MIRTAVIIPCYNEEKRLPVSQIKELIENSDVDIYFANDGSKDNTVGIIQAIINIHPERCFLFDYKTNQGKANVVFKAVNQLNTLNKYEFIGYFDADFSTPVEEVIRLVKEIETSGSEFVFGSRILLLNSGIKRKTYRHYIGRTILTIINQKFSLEIYDTQCLYFGF
jgi:dolichyl-phosphate beta-glucosyltransferase